MQNDYTVAAAIYHRELFFYVYRVSCSFPIFVHLTLENSAAGKQFQHLMLASIVSLRLSINSMQIVWSLLLPMQFLSLYNVAPPEIALYSIIITTVTTTLTATMQLVLCSLRVKKNPTSQIFFN